MGPRDYRQALVGILTVIVEQMESTDDQEVKDQRINDAVSALFAETASDDQAGSGAPLQVDAPQWGEMLALLSAAIVVQTMLLDQWATASGETRSELVRRFALLMASQDDVQ